MLITWAAIVFAIAALGGATLATLHFRGRTPLPMPLALLHGLLAASGLVLTSQIDADVPRWLRHGDDGEGDGFLAVLTSSNGRIHTDADFMLRG